MKLSLPHFLLMHCGNTVISSLLREVVNWDLLSFSSIFLSLLSFVFHDKNLFAEMFLIMLKIIRGTKL